MKVFGVGLPRTGTTSLTAALDRLGFRPALHNPVGHAEIALCGSATDLTIAWRFDRLARLWPDARFVYTNRPLKPWLASSERHFTGSWPELRDLGYDRPEVAHHWAYHEAMLGMFGTLEFARDDWEYTWRTHAERVRHVFAECPWRLLWTDLTDGRPDAEKWTELANFLGVEAPDGPFPHENQGEAGSAKT